MSNKRSLMPNLESLKFSVDVRALQDANVLGFEKLLSLAHLGRTSLQIVEAEICCTKMHATDVEKAEVVLANAAAIHPNHPTLKTTKKHVGFMLSSDKESDRAWGRWIAWYGGGGGRMEMDGAGGTTVIIRRDTDLQQPTRSNQYFEEEKTLQMISEQKKMDKLITTVFGIAATVGIAIFAVPPGSNTPLVNRLLVISTLISITISMAATVMVVVLLDTLACRWLRRVLVFTSCGSLWLVATLFLVGLNRSLVVAIPVALVVFFAAGRWPFSCLFSSSARREAGGLTTTIVHHGKKHTIKDVIFKKISKIFISTGFVGVFFGTNFTDYMAKASIVPGDVIYIWISIYLDFTIGLFLTASIATGLDALTDDYATTLYYIAAALLTVAFLLVMVVNCLRLVSQLST
uniref:Disease resistance R13L4/SHOC-2-like LRR domain-containing protein n=1 Tax=Oryza punctata TaxID=4537 RepID=A0A0E0LRR3_ORYPU